MRITTNMLNESFKKAGLPARGISLLDYIDSDKANASLLDALNKEQEATINNVEKDKYDKIMDKADKLESIAEVLVQKSDENLFEKAKVAGNNKEIYDVVENLFKSYNDIIEELTNNSSVMNDFYRKMITEASVDVKDALKNMGISFEKDGMATVDMSKVKTTDITTLENIFGKDSEYVNKLSFLASRVSDNAQANIRNLNSTYNSKGTVYGLTGNSKVNLLG